jgi:hypothetical protein
MAALRLCCVLDGAIDHRSGSGTHSRTSSPCRAAGNREIANVEADRGERRAIERLKRSACAAKIDTERFDRDCIWFMKQPKEQVLAAEEPVPPLLGFVDGREYDRPDTS